MLGKSATSSVLKGSGLKKKSQIGICGVARGLGWFSGSEHAALGLRQMWWVGWPHWSMGGVRFCVSKLGSQCQHSAASCRCSCTYAAWQGKEMAQVSFFVPRGISVNSPSLGHAPGWANNLPTLCPRHSSDPYFHTMFLGCLPAFFPGAVQCPLGPLEPSW